MDLKFGNKQFSNYLLGITKKTRKQVFVNIQSNSRNFLAALDQIGSKASVIIPRLTKNEEKKYSSNNSQGIKPESSSKILLSSNSTEGQSDQLSEKHSTTIEDLQSSPRQNIHESSNISFQSHSEDLQSYTSSNKLNHNHKPEHTNVSSSQNKPVLISEAKKYNKETMNQNESSNDHIKFITAPVEQLSVLVKKPDQKSSLDSRNQIKSTQDTSSINKSSTALSKINNSSENKTNTKDLTSTNKTHQNKSENIKKEVKTQMNSKSQNEKYKLTIVDLFGEDDSSREINIPAHKKICNNREIPKKIFGDKNSTGDITKMRRKSIFEENDERRFKCVDSHNKEDKKITNKIVVRRKTISQEVSRKDDLAKRRNRSKSMSQEVLSETVSSKNVETKLARRKSMIRDTESNEEGNRSKSQNTTPNSSKTNEEKVVPRTINPDIKSNKNDKTKRHRSKSRESVSSKSIIQNTESNEDDKIKTSKCKSRDKESVVSKTNDQKFVRRQSIVQDTESNGDNKTKRHGSKSREKESITTKTTERNLVRRKSIVQDVESNEYNKIRHRSKSLNKESVSSKTNEPKVVQRRRTIQDTESSEDEKIVRHRSKSYDKESVSLKSNKAKIVRRKSVIQTSESSEEDKTKRHRYKSRDKESVASKSSEARIVRSKSVCKDLKFSKDEKVRHRSRSCDKETTVSKNNETKLERKSICQKNESSVGIKMKEKTKSRDKDDKTNCIVNKTQKKGEDKKIQKLQSRDIEVTSKKTSKIDCKGTQLSSSKSISSISNNSLTKQTVEPLTKTSKSHDQAKTNFFTSLKLKNNDSSATSTSKRRFPVATSGSNSPAYLSDISSKSSNSSEDTWKLSKRQKYSNTPPAHSSRSSSKGKNTASVSRESSTNKKSNLAARKSSKDDTKNASVMTPKRTDSSNKKTLNKDKKTLSQTRSKSVDRKDTVATPKSSTDEQKKDSSNIPQRIKSVFDQKEIIEISENDSSSDASTIIITQRKVLADESNEASSILKRRKSACVSDETTGSSSDSSMDNVTLDKLNKLISNEENILQTPIRRKSSSTKDETIGTSSDMLYSCNSPLTSMKKDPSTLKRTTPLCQDITEENKESLIIETKRKKQEETVPKIRTRSLSRCSFFAPKDDTKEIIGKRKRFLSTCESCTENKDKTNKRRKSMESEETSPASPHTSYINYADLVEQMVVTPSTKKPVDFVAPLTSSKKGFSKPHYTDDVTYDSVIVIEEKENSSLKLLVRKKSKEEVEEFQKRIISRRHSFHFEDIQPKEEPDDSTEEKETNKSSPKPKESNKIIKRRKTFHEMSEASSIKSILKRRFSECSESSTTTTVREAVDLNDNNIPVVLPVTIDLQNIDIDKMFPSTSQEDRITLEISSDDGSPVRKESLSVKDLQDSILSTDSAICLADIEKDADEKIQEDMLKNKPQFPIEIYTSDINYMSTDQAVDVSGDLFVSLLYIYEQYYKMTEQVESQKLLGLTPDMTVKKNYFTKRRNSDLNKIYKKLTTVKVNHFSLIIFFDRLLKLLNEEFKKYKEISEIVIIYFMQRIIWILLDHFSSPSDEKYLFNHVTACESVEYLIAKYDNLAKGITDLDKKLNDCFNSFSKKINSDTVSSNPDATKPSSAVSQGSEPVFITLKKTVVPPKSSNSVPLKNNLSLPLIDAEESSTSKPNPAKKRRGRPPKKMVHPEAIAVLPNKPNSQVPTANVYEMTGIFDNINKNKSYLDNRSDCSKPSEETKEIGLPQLRRKSMTSYEIIFDINSTNNVSSSSVQQTIENVVQDSQKKQDTVVQNKRSNILDVVSRITKSSVDKNKFKNTGTQENTKLTDDILQLIPQNSKPTAVLKQRVISIDGLIVNQQINIENVASSKQCSTENRSSVLSPKERDSIPSLNIPKGQVQPNMYCQPKSQNPVTSQPGTIPIPVPAPIPTPVPAPTFLTLQIENLNLPQIDPKLPQSQANISPTVQSQHLRPVPPTIIINLDQNDPAKAPVNHVNPSLPRLISETEPPVSHTNTIPLNLSRTIKCPTVMSINQGSQHVSQTNLKNQSGKQFVRQSSPIRSQNNTVIPVSQAAQNLGQSSKKQGRKQFLQVSSQANTFVPGNQAQNSRNSSQSQKESSQSNIVIPNQNVPQNCNPVRVVHTGQNGPSSSQRNTLVPVSQGNQNLPQNNQVRALLTEQSRLPSSQSNQVVPVSQVNPNLSQISPYKQSRALVKGQNVPPTSRSNVVAPLSQVNPNSSRNKPNLTENAFARLQILSDIQVTQPQQKIPPLVQNNSVRQPHTVTSSVRQPQINNPQNVPQITHSYQQAMLPNYPHHQIEQNGGMINRPTPLYRYPNQEFVSYPVPPMYRQSTITNTYAVNEPVYPNLNYTYENVRLHTIAQQQYERMLMEQMMRKPPPYPEHIYNPVFRVGQPTNDSRLIHDQNQLNRSKTRQAQIHPNTTEAKKHPNMIPQLVQTSNHVMIQPSTQLQSAGNQFRPGEQLQQQHPVQRSTTRSIEINKQQHKVPPQQTSSRSIEELEAMTEETINYLLDTNNSGKTPSKKLIRPNLTEIDRLQKELEQINRNFPMTTTENIKQASYDMNSVKVTESSAFSAVQTASSHQHTIKWRMKKSLPIEQQLDSSSAEQNRQDGSVIRYQSEGHNVLRNISRDSGYLSPSDVAQQSLDQQGVICDRCMGPSNLMCSGCHTYYCSNECQQLSWPTHEKKCYTIIGPTE